ncbi:MAG: ATP-binding protein [Chlamydiae bacterium]|nr:ATP-binding protein [Chlamydiota bacterium]MBI3276654.1 ATP-binding protein [Chlamydiota bacterium]
MFAEHRNLEETIHSDLLKKFVFLSGPRQVGKTTLAKALIKKEKGTYLLYDDEEDRRKILGREYIQDAWVCLDEFHKFPRWKSQIKGVFDKYHETLHLLMTGSARLDVFQKSGDSLFGRYYLHHLHPLTCGELHSSHLPSLPSDLYEPHAEVDFIPQLLQFGGFPEPFYSHSEKEHRRWSNSRRHLLIQEELRELTQVELIGLIEQLMLLLPNRIGSLFSYRSLSEDIRVSVPTIQNWMEIFQRLFILFRMAPYSRKVTRSIQKQPKYYFYDWSQISEEGARFENFVASHLWKAVQVWTDVGEANLNLCFVRDRDGREVDFLITREGKPWFLVEAKLAESQISQNLRFFSNHLGVPGIQIVLKEGLYRRENNILLVSANRWLAHFP